MAGALIFAGLLALDFIAGAAILALLLAGLMAWAYAKLVRGR